MTKTLLFSAYYYVTVCPLYNYVFVFLYISYWCTSLFCGLVGRDMCVPFFTHSVSPAYQSLLFLCRKCDLHYNEKQWNISSIDD